jgi:hypothetical protein
MNWPPSWPDANPVRCALEKRAASTVWALQPSRRLFSMRAPTLPAYLNALYTLSIENAFNGEEQDLLGNL